MTMLQAACTCSCALGGSTAKLVDALQVNWRWTYANRHEDIELYLYVLGAVAIGLCDLDMQAALLSLCDDAIGTIAAPGVHFHAQQPNGLSSREDCMACHMSFPTKMRAWHAVCPCQQKT